MGAKGLNVLISWVFLKFILHRQTNPEPTTKSSSVGLLYIT